MLAYIKFRPKHLKQLTRIDVCFVTKIFHVFVIKAKTQTVKKQSYTYCRVTITSPKLAEANYERFTRWTERHFSTAYANNVGFYYQNAPLVFYGTSIYMFSQHLEY